MFYFIRLVAYASSVLFIDDRKASCWLEINNGRCENDIKQSVTKAECCGSIGKAWGSPCEVCPTGGKL